MRLKLTVLLIGLVAFVASAWCASACLAAEEPGVKVWALAGGMTALTADEAGITPFGRLEVDGPLVLGTTSIARAHLRLDLSGLPGETVDLSAVETFRGAELQLGAFRPIGRLGDVQTSAGGSWSFTTRLPRDPGPLERYPRRYGAGVRLEADRAYLEVLAGRCDWSGTPSWSWQIAGGLPIGVAVLGGDAVLSVGPPSSSGHQRADILRLFVALDLPDLVKRR